MLHIVKCYYNIIYYLSLQVMDLNILHNKYPYFSNLIEINHKFIPSSKNFNIREFSEDRLQLYEDILTDLFFKIDTIESQDELLTSILTTVSIIIFSQPFCDGNSRTAKTFLNILLTNLGYKFSYDFDSFIIPIFYNEDEKCDVEDLKKFKNKVKLKKR